jgi:mannose-1-phosphate guanylyltransferase
MKNTYIAIMAGGIGSRFWPASRVDRPKQFLDILGTGKSLLRMTYERFLEVSLPEHIFVLTNANYKALVKEQIPEISENRILCEPSRNNTAPCIAWMAFKLHDIDPDANFVVAPSDHVILNEDAFIDNIKHALSFTAANDAIVTLGIYPTRPDTGYGYIHYERNSIGGVFKVFKFIEKPNLKTAQKFLESGEYAWNAGIFIWRAAELLKSFETHAPEIHTILKKGNGLYNTSKEQAFINENYPNCPSISVDYAVLEKARNVYTIPSDIGWSDLGTWNSLHSESRKDENGNVIQADKIMAEELNNTFVRMPSGKLLVVKGLDNFIVVDEEDVLLIWPKDKEQEIKGITDKLTESGEEKFA